MNTAISKELFLEQVSRLGNQRLLDTRGWVMNLLEYPIVDITFTAEGRKSFRIRMTCDDWNSTPPAIELLAGDGNYLVEDTTPKGCGVINHSQHNITQRPFICSPGSREYHTHSSHVGDLWDNYKSKSGFDLGGIITQIYRAWKHSTHDL